eukprot:SAG22_NODE_707_length_7758_cov_8.503199_4_plen_365_part_00
MVLSGRARGGSSGLSESAPSSPASPRAVRSVSSPDLSGTIAGTGTAAPAQPPGPASAATVAGDAGRPGVCACCGADAGLGQVECEWTVARVSLSLAALCLPVACQPVAAGWDWAGVCVLWVGWVLLVLTVVPLDYLGRSVPPPPPPLPPLPSASICMHRSASLVLTIRVLTCLFLFGVPRAVPRRALFLGGRVRPWVPRLLPHLFSLLPYSRQIWQHRQVSEVRHRCLPSCFHSKCVEDRAFPCRLSVCPRQALIDHIELLAPHADLVVRHRSVLLPVLDKVRTKALPFCCASTVFSSKTVPFRAVLHNTQLLPHLRALAPALGVLLRRMPEVEPHMEPLLRQVRLGTARDHCSCTPPQTGSGD